MTKATSYEIHTLKEGQWQLDSVYDRKDDAMHEARKMYASRKHISGVKVLQEEFDSEANKASSYVLLNEVRGVKKTKAKIKKKTEEKPAAVRPKSPPKPEKKGSASQSLLLMILGLCAVLLAVVGAAMYYTGAFK